MFVFEGIILVVIVIDDCVFLTEMINEQCKSEMEKDVICSSLCYIQQYTYMKVPLRPLL